MVLRCEGCECGTSYMGTDSHWMASKCKCCCCYSLGAFRRWSADKIKLWEASAPPGHRKQLYSSTDEMEEAWFISVKGRPPIPPCINKECDGSYWPYNPCEHVTYNTVFTWDYDPIKTQIEQLNNSVV